MSEVLKQGHIVEAAIRRFSYYGVHKTTLTEIAEDLALSKQSLAYYFPDKQSLINAVGNKIASDYMNSLQEVVGTAASVEEGLLNLVEVKRNFFQKYYMLAIQARNQEMAGTGQMADIQQKLKNEEVQTVSGLIRKGMSSGELQIQDDQKTALLLLDTLYALSFCARDKIIFQDEKLITELFEKQKALVTVFYHGLKSGAHHITNTTLNTSAQ